jgi:hypothetical protein
VPQGIQQKLPNAGFLERPAVLLLQGGMVDVPGIAARGELKSVTIGARRLVPLNEVERAEQFGVGHPRMLQPKK